MASVRARLRRRGVSVQKGALGAVDGVDVLPGLGVRGAAAAAVVLEGEGCRGGEDDAQGVVVVLAGAVRVAAEVVGQGFLDRLVAVVVSILTGP